ncbi:anti-sigma factor [Dyella monticola]|uniref:Anti-sigma factor n=1 Tax=Dyella monticola TaxID=1927958 RepID=A0A370X8N3_9GAMM|nr:anti-sigma factor [Dyella monticola]RDS84779.1 anti-sigma factor [Dyella monticola]
MMCDDARLLLHAYLDNELDASQSVAMEHHLRHCSACAAQHADFLQLRAAFTQASLYRRAPDALRVQWSFPEPTSAANAAPARTRRAPIALSMAAGFAAALLITLPAFYALHRHDNANLTVEEAISGHIRSMQPQHLMDVISTDQHTVKPWFAGKLDFSPRVKDLANAGFPLVGGRLDALDGHDVAALIYRRRLHVINLYQWPVSSETAAVSVSQQRGYTVIQWTDEHMRFVAISDVEESQLQQFVQLFRNDAVSPLMR